ncbi:MAG: pitrilysin family protein [Candidatus Parcubacteria bacterium]|nr:pitrilysin family protein [Candidatus Parcubacteria bacterium]
MFKKLLLKNGLPVVLAPKKESQSVALFLIYKVGSRYEKEAKIFGISHFIEHLMFKGTKKRPSTLAISKELDSIGADYNAFTAKDHTAYHIKVNAENLDLACDILSDMLHNSLFDKDKLEQEKGVILEEIKMYEDQPIQYAEMLFEEQIFSGSDLEHNIAGTRASVKGISREDIINYLQNFYSPQNAILVIAGKIDKNIKKILDKYFVRPGFGQNFKTKAEFKNLAIKQKKPQAILNYKKTNQAHIALGFPAYSYFDPKLYAFYILATILGGNMSSRLFIDVREKQGLCYYIRAQADVYEDTGDLLIRAGLDVNNVDKGLKIIAQDLKAIKEKGITSEELLKAKKFLKGRLTMQLEELNDLAEFYGREFLLVKHLLTPEQKINKILAVTRREVNQVAKEILNKQKLNFAMVSPFKDKNKFIKLLNI